MRPAAIVVDGEFGNSLSQMPLVERDDVVETLAPDCSDEAFAPGIGRGRPDGRLQQTNAAVPNRLIDVRAE